MASNIAIVDNSDLCIADVVPPYIVQVDANHVVEVRKKGLQVGIYTLTVSGKKRGILLPVKTWRSLERLHRLINVALDLAGEVITPSELVQSHFCSKCKADQVNAANETVSDGSTKDGRHTLHRKNLERRCKHAGDRRRTATVTDIDRASF